MNKLSECYFLHRTLTFDEISKNSQCKNVKCKRAFQFLQLLFLQRVYGIDVITHSSKRRLSKQDNEFEVFLGGSCNPTTWRYEQAIPYFQSRLISYYNPQSTNWTPDLVELEHRAKELASLLFFVIDSNTRSLAAIIELCYLAARGRKIIVVINSIAEDKNQLKYIQEKHSSNEIDDQYDYENVCQARKLMRRLLQYINIPIFDNIRLALECSAYLLDTAKQDCHTFDHRIYTPCHLRRISIGTKTQLSCLTNESDDDGGYRSGDSSHRTLSRSTSSVLSDFFECSPDENNHSGFQLSGSKWNNITSSFSSYISFWNLPKTTESIARQSFFNLCTLPFRFIKNILLPSITNTVISSDEILQFDPSHYMFDLYIASGAHDEYWLNTCALPLLEEINVKYTKREMYNETDELDILYDIHIRKQTRLLYYLINDNERLSHLTTELAFLIGERNYHIIVCLQSRIDENSEKILTKHERKDLERSRQYLEDIAAKENISLYHSREQSWQHVLAFFLH